MKGPDPQEEPYIDQHEANPAEVRDELEDLHREGTKGWYPEKPDGDTQIWRYMDLGKFISLIQNSQLWFSHASKFEDPYEGRYSKAKIKKISREKWGIDDPSDEEAEFVSRENTNHYVSCWNMKESQSAALWDSYIEGNNGVAIRSTVNDLGRSIVGIPEEKIQNRMVFGKVKYHISGDEPQGYYAPIFTKRKIFDFENEYRAVLTVFDSLDDTEIAGTDIDPKVGIGMNINPEILINEVYISPNESGYLRDVVEALERDYEPDYTIEQSTVFDHPLVD